MTDSTVFLRKVKEFDRLIHHASRRYVTRGIADQSEDLYQEGLLVLDYLLKRDLCDPDSDDFKRMFTTSLYHKMKEGLRFNLQDCRNPYYTSIPDTVQAVIVYGNRHNAQEGVGKIPNEFHPSINYEGTPESEALTKEAIDRATEFLERLIQRIDTEACLVLNEMLYPRSWEDIPDEYKGPREWSSSTYLKPPEEIPQHVIGNLLGISRARVQRAMSRIREQAIILREELDFDGLCEAVL